MERPEINTHGLIYCCRSRNFSDRYKRKQWSNLDSGVLVNQLLQALKISGFGHMRISQQYETQFDSPTKAIWKLAELLRFYHISTSGTFSVPRCYVVSKFESVRLCL